MLSFLLLKNCFMAEINQPESKHKRHQRRRSKKLSTRVDLTPMVDLGFLLITFFIFTTTLSEHKTMGMVLPNDKPVKEPPLAGKSKVLNLILKDDKNIICYNGDDLTNPFSATYNAESLRAILIKKKQAVAAKFGDGNETIILIKPTSNSTYRNLVAVLDEMQINSIKKYMLLQPSKEETVL
jgi:biopolymer transport protein ExbD